MEANFDAKGLIIPSYRAIGPMDHNKKRLGGPKCKPNTFTGFLIEPKGHVRSHMGASTKRRAIIEVHKEPSKSPPMRMRLKKEKEICSCPLPFDFQRQTRVLVAIGFLNLETWERMGG